VKASIISIITRIRPTVLQTGIGRVSAGISGMKLNH